MAGGRGKIHEHPNAGINNLKHRPQDINRKGTPRKGYNSFVLDRKAEGIEMVCKKDIKDVMSQIFNMSQDELLEIAQDTKMPFSIRSVIQSLLNPITRQKELQDWRDWCFGKAEQEMKIENTVISPTLKVEFVDD